MDCVRSARGSGLTSVFTHLNFRIPSFTLNPENNPGGQVLLQIRVTEEHSLTRGCRGGNEYPH